jgi:hypothetical protein
MINYSLNSVVYTTFDNKSSEVLRLTRKPTGILVDGKALIESAAGESAWTWTPLAGGGVLKISKVEGKQVTVNL